LTRHFSSRPREAATSTFRAARGGCIDGERVRYRHWTPALRTAGIDHRRVYDCRPTFASSAIAGGVQLLYLARIMGTSVAQIDATYGHLLPDSEGYLRGLLDAYDEVDGLSTDLAGARTKKPLLIPGNADERT
jgi:integrase